MSESVSIEEVFKSHRFNLILNKREEYEILRPSKKIFSDEVKVVLYLIGIIILIGLFFLMGGRALIFGIIAFIISLNDYTKSKSKSSGDKITISKYGISIESKKSKEEYKPSNIDHVYGDIEEKEYGGHYGVVGIELSNQSKVTLLKLEESELEFLKTDLEKIRTFIEEKLT